MLVRAARGLCALRAARTVDAIGEACESGDAFRTEELREFAQVRCAGDALRRAAVTEPHESDGAALLLVNAGLDLSRPLATQKDSYWWPSAGFDQINQPYGDFARIVRGFDKRAGGLTEGLFTVSLDGGAGRGGTLLAVCLDGAGAVVDTLEA